MSAITPSGTIAILLLDNIVSRRDCYGSITTHSRLVAVAARQRRERKASRPDRADVQQPPQQAAQRTVGARVSRTGTTLRPAALAWASSAAALRPTVTTRAAPG